MIDKIWGIMVEAFPNNERSSYNIQKGLFDLPNYNCKTIEENGEILGFICYWCFDDFNYIEHIGISKKHRGKGLGSKLIKEIINLGKKIILEIEDTQVKDNDKELKRLNFYKNLGFQLINQEYYQLPLNKNDKPIKMELLSYPKLFTDKEIKDTITIIKDNVYKNRF